MSNTLFAEGGCSKGALQSPSSANSARHGVWTNANSGGPVREIKGLSVERKENGPSAIGQLLFGRRPAAIARFVIAVVVDAVKRHSVWSRPHIGEEILKYKPAIADLDSASSIKVPIGCLGIAAPIFHTAPQGVFGWQRNAVFLVDPKRYAFQRTTLGAATALCVAKILGLDNRLVAAVTRTFPKRSNLPTSRERDNRKASEFVTNLGILHRAILHIEWFFKRLYLKGGCLALIVGGSYRRRT